MSDDSDLPHAIISLAKATAEMGVVFRLFVEQLDDETRSRHETNRILGGISDQNGQILVQLEKMAVESRDSQRELRAVGAIVDTHVEYLVEVGKKCGLPAPRYEAARRHPAADR